MAIEQPFGPEPVDDFALDDDGFFVHPIDPDDNAGTPWQWTDPPQDRTAIPYNDDDTKALIDQAVETLVLIRCPTGLGDPGPTLSVLASLAADIQNRFDDAVADARDHSYTWDQIASRLAVSPRTAQRRHAAYTTWRKEGCPWPTPGPDNPN